MMGCFKAKTYPSTSRMLFPFNILNKVPSTWTKVCTLLPGNVDPGDGTKPNLVPWPGTEMSSSNIFSESLGAVLALYAKDGVY